MGNDTGDSKNEYLDGSNIQQELSTLVKEKVVPKKIADKLGEKLIEKKVKINKEQLRMLVTKIMDIIKNQKGPSVQNQDMHTFVEAIERLEERISNLETGGKTTGYVTTDDINVPGTSGLDMDPLLKVPGDPESVIVVMKWLQFLIDKCGHSKLNEVLDYYVDIGWISDDAKISLLDYSSGIIEDESKSENIKIGASELPSRDHIQSLMFIQKLKGNKFDKHFLERVEGEINRIVKKLDSYHFKQ